MSPLDVLSEPVWQRLTWTLLHFLWQGLAVAVVVATLLHVWPLRRAGHRYLMYLSTLVAMAACPLVTFLVIQVPESTTVASGEVEMETEAFLPPPASWLTEMTPEVLEAVIAHELAHIRRWDLWVNLLQRVVETLLFYHPVVWWLSRHVGLEREMCTDELAFDSQEGPYHIGETVRFQMLARNTTEERPDCGSMAIPR